MVLHAEDQGVLRPIDDLKRWHFVRSVTFLFKLDRALVSDYMAYLFVFWGDFYIVFVTV